jgi:hypothetical protein
VSTVDKPAHRPDRQILLLFWDKILSRCASATLSERVRKAAICFPDCGIVYLVADDVARRRSACDQPINERAARNW